MIKHDELIVARAIALVSNLFETRRGFCYCNLGRTQMAKKFEEYGI
jgi:hypothetical protein